MVVYIGQCYLLPLPHSFLPLPCSQVPYVQGLLLTHTDHYKREDVVNQALACILLLKSDFAHISLAKASHVAIPNVNEVKKYNCPLWIRTRYCYHNTCYV